MRRVLPVFLVVLLVFAVAGAKEKKSSLRAELLSAKFVFVTAYPGTNPDSVRLGTAGIADDRRAIADVEEALRKWGRWTPIQSAEQADLIITVRKGRIANTGVRIPIGGVDIPPTRNGTRSPKVEAEAGPNDDMIAIYSGHGWGNVNYNAGDPNLDAPPIWRVIQANALMSPKVPGIQQLRKEIEKAEAENAKAKK
jgi:hypothetical protein